MAAVLVAASARGGAPGSGGSGVSGTVVPEAMVRSIKAAAPVVSSNSMGVLEGPAPAAVPGSGSRCECHTGLEPTERFLEERDSNIHAKTSQKKNCMQDTQTVVEIFCTYSRFRRGVETPDPRAPCARNEGTGVANE